MSTLITNDTNNAETSDNKNFKIDNSNLSILEVSHFFVSSVYFINRPDFLPIVTEVSEENLIKVRDNNKLNNIYPVYMSDNYFQDQRLIEFTQFIGSTAWNILNEQGYFMENNVIQFLEMWTQEHYKHSGMDQHTHGYGSQIVGLYFLDVPKNSSRLVFHDPRPGKVQIDLFEKNTNLATIASKAINFEPKPGMFVFSNSWLPHSFTRHSSNKPLKFVHFNLTVASLKNFIKDENIPEII